MTESRSPGSPDKNSSPNPQNGISMKHLGIRVLALIHLVVLLLRTAATFVENSSRGPARSADHPERGDVPGWVMITLMSAVLVAALLALAGPALEGLFNQAMDKVGN